MIRVVKVNKLYGADREGVVYVGRAWLGWPASPWGNPFKPGRDGTIEECLEQYGVWLLMQQRDEGFDDKLTALWEATGHGEKPLGCWCTNATAGDGSFVVCHAQILAELLRERFEESK